MLESYKEQVGNDVAHQRPARPFTKVKGKSLSAQEWTGSKSSRTCSEMPKHCADPDPQVREYTTHVYKNAKGKPIILHMQFMLKFHVIQ